MSRLQPGPDEARARHGADVPCPESEPALPSELGWCLPCYEHGAFTLASGPGHSTCLLHGDLLAALEPASTAFGTRGRRELSRAPRGRAYRATAYDLNSGPNRLPRARSRVRALNRGRERARHRLRSRQFQPHPGWRNFIEPQYRVLTSQPEALRYLARRVEDEDWRSDKRHSWGRILQQLVRHMDWSTGLITGITVEQLGAAGGRAARTVSRVLAWARDDGILVVVECGASAEFLDSDTGRTPTYALVTTDPPAAVSEPDGPVDESGDLPIPLVGRKPLTGGTRPRHRSKHSWPAHAVPDSPESRNRASLTLLTRIGLDGRQGGEIEIWRARALLKPWWDSGACVATLLHAVEFHPDRPAVPRGDVGAAARDPLGVLGARLRPWRDRLSEMPAAVMGHPMTAEPPPAGATAPRPTVMTRRSVDTLPPVPAADPRIRALAREALREHLDALREQRRTTSHDALDAGYRGLPVGSRLHGPAGR